MKVVGENISIINKFNVLIYKFGCGMCVSHYILLFLSEVEYNYLI
jgi:hypothetical protein